MPRFRFGQNWTSYAQNALSPERVQQARAAFDRLVPARELRGKRYLDVGFGQGLPLLLAAEAGADATGIDIDADNLTALAHTQRHLGLPASPRTVVGSILDDAAVRQLSDRGPYDVVYSWGVLHHTGAMWSAIERCAQLVGPGGKLVIALYRTHWSSPVWRVIKHAYVSSPEVVQRGLVALFYPVIYAAKFAVTGKNPHTKERGMDFYHDVIDWVGGYPYEYATKGEVTSFLEARGCTLEMYLPATTPTGCDEFVFRAGG